LPKQFTPSKAILTRKKGKDASNCEEKPQLVACLSPISPSNLDTIVALQPSTLHALPARPLTKTFAMLLAGGDRVIGRSRQSRKPRSRDDRPPNPASTTIMMPKLPGSAIERFGSPLLRDASPSPSGT